MLSEHIKRSGPGIYRGCFFMVPAQTENDRNYLKAIETTGLPENRKV